MELQLEKYGDWEVLSSSFKKGTRFYKSCKCVCGTERDVLVQNLIKQSSKNCGCSKPERMRQLIETNINKDKRVKRSFSGLRKVFNLYKIGARKRSYSWELSIEQFEKLTQSNCYYCKSPPDKISKCKSKRSSVESVERTAYRYNGVDRVDSSIGYLITNVVPCCWACNKMKSTLSLDKFLEIIKKIYNNLIKEV